ncbi:MAG: palindromic element RPE4 domain-containing protein [Gammaproteobacteria bacterium]|nr:palindromic element RPE4 domain-containing protein [Gammaproteobacteria bacterium]
MIRHQELHHPVLGVPSSRGQAAGSSGCNLLIFLDPAVKPRDDDAA